jgi:hypothetical protein
MRHESTEFILLYESLLVALQEKCTTYHMTETISLFNESDQTESSEASPMTRIMPRPHPQQVMCTVEGVALTLTVDPYQRHNKLNKDS